MQSLTFIAIMVALSVGFLQTPISRLNGDDNRTVTMPLQTLFANSRRNIPKIILLWRANCAPCLVELQRMAAFRQAAGETEIVTLALDTKAQAQTAIARHSLPISNGYVTSASPRQVMLSTGQPFALLPMAVAVSGNGKICGSHVGILGTLKVRDWAARC